MILELENLSPNQIYFHLIQTLVPRPVAWVLSVNENNSYNLAPFSYFNAVCSEPPLLMISVGKKPDGSEKDSRRNIKRHKHFTIHIADVSLLEALNTSSATLQENISELDALDLNVTTVDFDGAPVPRLAECKIAYACELYDCHEIGPSEQAVIYGKVNAIYIDDQIASVNERGRIKVDAAKLQPLSRLGADEYSTLGDVIRLKRPL